MAQEETTLVEVLCFECRKPIPTVPSWLSNAKVRFHCEECRQKGPKVHGMSDVGRVPVVPHEDLATAAVLPPEDEVYDDEDAEVEEDVADEADEV